MFISKSRPIQTLDPPCLCSLTYCISRLSVIIYASNFLRLSVFTIHMGSCLCMFMLLQMVSFIFRFFSSIFISRHIHMPLGVVLHPPYLVSCWFTCLKNKKIQWWSRWQLDPAATGQSRLTGPWHCRPIQTREPRLAVKSKPDSTGL